jgi:uncharacterized OB-fold protein
MAESTAPVLPAYNKPLPRITAVSRPFWEAAREHRLLVQRSQKTGRYVFYPRAVSPFGADDALDWVEVSGRGIVYTFSVTHQPTGAAWAGDVPYAIAVVQLEEGVHMTANIVDCDPERIYIGMPVEVRFVDVTPDVTLVQFGPAGSGPAGN